MLGGFSRLALTALLLAVAFVPSSGQAGAQLRLLPRDTILAAGPHYDAGGLHRLLFGGEYRDLWTAPIRVPILEIQKVGGGLTPTTAGGGFQTKSLRFRGRNGLQYGFRSVDKDPDVLPPGLEGTVVQRLVQDQISSEHPAGPAIAAVLMEASEVLHAEPRLVVLPDAVELAEFRERFAGTLGFFAERPIAEHAVPFAGALETIASDSLLGLVQRDAEHRIDTRRFLAARLIDILIGDWDRHRGQWTWARFDNGPIKHWVPIPEDRDQAFVRFDGLVLSVGRMTTPQLVNFGDRFPGIFGLTWNGRELDRRFLVELEWPVWDSVVTSLQVRLTNAIIDSAVAQTPTEYRRIEGARMAHALRSRRDALGDAARSFYGLLAREVAIHGTDAADAIVVRRNKGGSTTVTISPVAGPVGRTYFAREFNSEETSEIRIYMQGGDDRATVSGAGPGATIRFIGGKGQDVLVDSSSSSDVHFYSDDGDAVRGTNRVKLDTRPFELPPQERPSELPPRDWGALCRGVPWMSFGPDVGLFAGGGGYRTRFGFRHIPFASKIQVRAGYSTGGRTGRVDLAVQLHRSNSRLRTELNLRASGIEVLRFYGFGNENSLSGPNDDEYYRVNHTQYSFSPSLIVPIGDVLELSSGPMIRYTRTINETGRYLETVPDIYGSGGFGHVGWTATVNVDTRDVPSAATRGVRFEFGGSVFPEMWDVRDTYFELHGVASTYLSSKLSRLQPTLALRLGAKRVWGEYPFQDAAYIGDASSVRLGRQNRYGGDAAAYANAELRVRLSRIFIVLPGHFGLLGLGDLGRVYLDGEISSRWHNAIGGGVWMSFLSPANTLSMAIARSEVGNDLNQRTSVYIHGGFAF